MTIDEFIDFEKSIRVARPSIFRLASPDPPASEEDIARAEAVLGCRLPDSYRQFLKRFGGGEYPLMNVFSVCPDSPWYIVKRVEKDRDLFHRNLLPVHDDQAGGFLVLRVVDGRALEPVYYLEWETSVLSNVLHTSVLSAVASYLASN